MEEWRDLIENYQFNLNQSRKLQEKLNSLIDYYTKVTAAYGHNTGGGKGSVSSKVERHVMKIIDTRIKLNEYEYMTEIVDKAVRVLNKEEKEVIDLIKQGYRNKLTKIAKALGKDKDYVYTRRQSAIKKMSKFIGR